MTKLTRIGLGLAMAAIGGVMVMGRGSVAYAANPDPVISIAPASQTVAVNQTVNLAVNVQGAFNLSAYGIELIYDPYIVTFDSAQNGTFVTTTSVPGLQCQPALDREANQPGNEHPGMRRAYLACAAVSESSPTVQGAGLLMTFSFKAVGGGTTALMPSKLDLLTPLSLSICWNDGPHDFPQPPRPTPTPLPALCSIVAPQASITVDGPVLPRPTVDPNATATSTPGAFATPTRVTGASNTATAGTTITAGSTGTTGATGTGTTPGGTISSGGALGSEAQAGSSSTGGSQGAGASGANNTGVGRFGSGPDAYATGDGSAALRTRAIAIAVLGMALIVVGIWQRGRIKIRREVVRRHEP